MSILLPIQGEPNVYEFFLRSILVHQFAVPPERQLDSEQAIFCARSLDVYTRTDRQVAGMPISYLGDLFSPEVWRRLDRHPHTNAEAAAFILVATNFRLHLRLMERPSRRRTEFYDHLAINMFHNAAASRQNAYRSKLLRSFARNYRGIKATLRDVSLKMQEERRNAYMNRMTLKLS